MNKAENEVTLSYSILWFGDLADRLVPLPALPTSVFNMLNWWETFYFYS